MTSSLSRFGGRVVRSWQQWYSIPVVLLLWQATAASGAVSGRLMPGLEDIAAAFWSDLWNGHLLGHAFVSLYRALAGFLLGCLLGVILGTAMARVRLFDRLFEPFFFLGYPVPKIALFPVFTFIFGIGTPSKITFTALECLYPVTVTTYLAVKGVQKRLIWSARSMGAMGPTVFWRVLLPAALPGIFSGIRIALPMAVTVVIVTEMIGDTRGLGYYITIASASFKYDHVYAGVVAVGVIGFALDRLLVRSRRWLMPWDRMSRNEAQL